MNLLQACVLGIVQGLTEFVPISSSAHLVLVPWLLNWRFDPQAAFVFDVLVQDGTLLAVIVYFWRDLVGLARAAALGIVHGRRFADPQARLAWLLVLASLPAAVAGLLLKDLVEAAFGSPMAVSGFLLVTAALLIVSERLGRRARRVDDLRPADALWVGLAQALALLPGISRSGATISAGLIRDLDRPEAARFSFLMSIPVMIGAGAVALRDLLAVPDAGALVPVVAAGAITATVTGYLSIRWLLRYLATRPLTRFAWYCAVVGLAGLAMSLIRG